MLTIWSWLMVMWGVANYAADRASTAGQAGGLRIDGAGRIPFGSAVGPDSSWGPRRKPQGHHDESRVLGRPRRRLLDVRCRCGRRGRTDDRWDFRNERQRSEGR